MTARVPAQVFERRERELEQSTTPPRSFFYALGARAQQALTAVRPTARCIYTWQRHELRPACHAGRCHPAAEDWRALRWPDQGVSLEGPAALQEGSKQLNRAGCLQGGSMGGLSPDSGPYTKAGYRQKAGKLPKHLWVRCLTACSLPLRHTRDKS